MLYGSQAKTKQKHNKIAIYIDEKLEAKSLIFFVSFFSCDLQDFKFWYVNHKSSGEIFLYWGDFKKTFYILAK